MKEMALMTAGVIFLLVSAIHLSRLIFKFELKVGKFAVPLWFNIFGFIATLALSLWMFTAK